MTQPGSPGEPRIGDKEREQAIHILGDHYAQGRINVHEYDERVQQATQSHTGSELGKLFADLPGPHPAYGTPMGVMPPMPAPPRPPYGPSPSTGHGFPPYGMDEYSDKSKLAAGLLQLFLPFGVGRFYTGHTGVAVGQLVLFVLGVGTCGVTSVASSIWCFIDGIVLLTSNSTDSYGRRLKN